MSKGKWEIEDLTGRVFHEWTVLSYAGPSPSRQQVWKCRCSCGTEALVQGGNLKSGMSKRCRKCGSRAAALKRWSRIKEGEGD